VAARGPHRRLFDLWSLVYDAPLVQRVTYRPPQDAVVGALEGEAPGRVLDIGCGTGQLTARLARVFPDALLVGCDFSHGMLQHARARSLRPGWVQGDAGRLPFADASFGAVVSTEAFHWFPAPDEALAEFRRVLAPRGRLLLVFVNPPFELLSTVTRVGSQLFGEPFRWPTPARLRRQIERAGFRVDEQRRVFRLPMPLAFPPVLTRATKR
jgi:SAM-dependent methyltransferase